MNDRLGHAAGDILLKNVAMRLKDSIQIGAFGTADVAVSIGIAVLPDHAETPGELMLRSDQALYRSKNARLGLPVVFEKDGLCHPSKSSQSLPSKAEALATDIRNSLAILLSRCNAAASYT